MTPLQRDVSTRLASLRDMLDRVESFATQEPQDGAGVQGAALAALECHAAADTDLDGIGDLLVRHARVEQASWTQVAEPLGMTKQGAQQRWGKSGGNRAPRTSTLGSV